MALLDAVARLQPGVLSDEDSHHLDSFNPALDGLLDCPHYTRPEIWEDKACPKPFQTCFYLAITSILSAGGRSNAAHHSSSTVQICCIARQSGHLSPREAVLAKTA